MAESNKTDWRWPVGLIIALLIVMLMNAAFIYVAVSDRDEVVPSYHTEPR